MVELSLTDSSLTFATVGDGRYSFFPLVHNKGLAPGEEGETTPTTTVGLLRPLIYGGDSTDLKSTQNIV